MNSLHESKLHTSLANTHHHDHIRVLAIVYIEFSVTGRSVSEWARFNGRAALSGVEPAEASGSRLTFKRITRRLRSALPPVRRPRSLVESSRPRLCVKPASVLGCAQTGAYMHDLEELMRIHIEVGTWFVLRVDGVSGIGRGSGVVLRRCITRIFFWRRDFRFL